MISVPDRAALERLLAGELPSSLRMLLESRLAATEAAGLTDLTHYVVIQPDDTEEDILAAVGFSPLVNPIDGARFGTPDFHPWADWIATVACGFEMVFAVGNSGFAYILFVERDREKDELIIMCERASGLEKGIIPHPF